MALFATEKEEFKAEMSKQDQKSIYLILMKIKTVWEGIVVIIPQTDSHMKQTVLKKNSSK